MAVRLRLRRVGRKKFPIYKVVAADSRSPRDGRYIESVGQYEPLRQSNNVEFKEDRVMYWLQNGAQPTDTVRNLLSSQGLWLKWSLIKKGAEEGVISEQMDKFTAQRAEKEQRAQEKAKAKKKEKPAPEVQEPAEQQTTTEELSESGVTVEPADPEESKEARKSEEKPEEQSEPESAQEQQPEEKPEEKADDEESEKKE